MRSVLGHVSRSIIPSPCPPDPSTLEHHGLRYIVPSTVHAERMDYSCLIQPNTLDRRVAVKSRGTSSLNYGIAPSMRNSTRDEIEGVLAGWLVGWLKDARRAWDLTMVGTFSTFCDFFFDEYIAWPVCMREPSRIFDRPRARERHFLLTSVGT